MVEKKGGATQTSLKSKLISKEIDEKRTFYTLEELAAEWQCTQEAILDLGANNELTLSAIVTGVIEAEQAVRKADSAVSAQSASGSLFCGPMRIPPEAVWKILAKGKTQTGDIAAAMSIEFLIMPSDISVCDIPRRLVVVTKRSRNRFISGLPPEEIISAPKEEPKLLGMLALLYVEERHDPLFWNKDKINVSQLIKDIQIRLGHNGLDEGKVPTGFKHSSLSPKLKLAITLIDEILPEPIKAPKVNK